MTQTTRVLREAWRSSNGEESKRENNRDQQKAQQVKGKQLVRQKCNARSGRQRKQAEQSEGSWAPYI